MKTNHTKDEQSEGRTDIKKLLIEKGNLLRRTDDTEMSHDHTYDEAIDDYQNIINEVLSE